MRYKFLKKGTKADAPRWLASYQEYLQAGGHDDECFQHYALYHKSWLLMSNTDLEKAPADIEETCALLNFDGERFEALKKITDDESKLKAGKRA